MTKTRSEQLFDMLFDVIDELTELESSDVIFDSIVDHLAAQTEYHMGQADTFKAMLDTFRHDNPMETIPDDNVDVENVDLSAPPSFEELYGGMNDINRNLMSENQDILSEFMRSVQFPGTLDS